MKLLLLILLTFYGAGCSQINDQNSVQFVLENANANEKRFIVTTEEPYAFQEVAKILKSNGYDKVSTKLAPNFLLKIMSYLDREAKSMRSFVGKTYNGNVSLTMKTFDWKPVPIEKTVLDTAKSIESYIN